MARHCACASHEANELAHDIARHWLRAALLGEGTIPCVLRIYPWFNHRRLHGEIGLTPPAAYETNHYRHNPAPATVEASVPSRH